MADKTSIEWCDATWNPVVGCSRVSEGCRACYAFELHDRRHRGFLNGSKLPYQYAKPFSEIQLFPDRLDAPLHWKTPRRVFVNSLSDLFHEDVPFEFIDMIFAAMAQAPHHTFQILTKRPQRMQCWFTGNAHLRMMRCFRNFTTYTDPVGPWPLPHVWLGVSVEDQHTADERIPLLLQTPAAVLWVSAEPLLGRVDLFQSDELALQDCIKTGKTIERGLDWVVVGGESGPSARPTDLAHIRSIVQQCQAAKVPCFVKQLGSKWFDRTAGVAVRGTVRVPVDDGRPMLWVRQRDAKGGDWSDLEFPEDLKVREWPRTR